VIGVDEVSRDIEGEKRRALRPRDLHAGYEEVEPWPIDRTDTGENPASRS
jgi:hypothetical protein